MIDSKEVLEKVAVIVHPSSAAKDSGAGHDRYAFEILQGMKRQTIASEIFQSPEIRSMPAAFVAEAKMLMRLRSSSFRPQVWHATATLNAQSAITTKRTPLITTIHDVLWFSVKGKYESNLKYLLKSYGIKRAALKSTRLIVPFPSTFRFLAEALKVPESKMSLVPYGVDHQAFFPKAAAEIVERPTFFPVGRKVVFFVGALTIAKGVDSLIEAFSKIREVVPEACLVLGSKGWDEGYLRRLASESSARDDIHFAGYIPEHLMRSCYLHAAVTCFPSRYGFGLPTMESMACGTPTVSGNTLDAPDFVGSAGLLVDPNQPEDIAEKILKILTNHSFAQSLVAAGIEKCKNYSWDLTADRTIDVYRSML